MVAALRIGPLADTVLWPAIAADPKRASPHEAHAGVWRDEGDTAEAIADHTEALRLDPAMARACDDRGNVHHHLGEEDLAVADQRQGGAPLRSEAPRGRPRQHRHRAARPKGSHQALADLDQALRIDATNVRADRLRGDVPGRRVEPGKSGPDAASMKPTRPVVNTVVGVVER